MTSMNYSARSRERQKAHLEQMQIAREAKKKRKAQSLEQWKHILEERHARKIAALKAIEHQSHTWITAENLDERIEDAVDAIMTPK